MSNKSKKKNSKSKHKRNNTSKPKKRADLKSVLQSIYHDTIDLSTTCNHTCECCKVAMPQINYSEFLQIATTVWKTKTHDEILKIICKSLEYFFRYEYEKWGEESLIKPCMFLGENDRCTIYEDRPLNCRLYGLWPEEVYNERVDKFAKAYEKHGLKRENLPLNKQCPLVKRNNNEKELTKEIIDELFEKLDNLDKQTGNFSNLQIKQKENYRTFHDWLLLAILGEDWLSKLTAFILAADRDTMIDQLLALQDVIKENFKDKLPEIK